MPFKNFEIWRGRLPHWRADDVTYYVTFRHRRDLDPAERRILFRLLAKPDGMKWNLLILSVLENQTDLVFRVREAPTGRPYELSDIVEKAKTKAGKLIIKKTGERFSPFYNESFDRILRNEEELEDRWLSIFDAPTLNGLCDDAEEYEFLYVANAPE